MTTAVALAPEAWNPEHALVGTLLQGGPASVSAVAEEVGPADFADERAGAIFEAILALDAGGKPVSLVTVAEVLKALGKLALAGGPAFLAALPESQGLAPVTEYARLVREKGKLVARLVNSFPLRDGNKPLARVEGLTCVDWCKG